MNNIERNINKTNEEKVKDPVNNVTAETNEERSEGDPFSVKRKIIPEDWKENIDEIIAKELVSANRYFAETNKDLVQLIAKESTHDPITYLRDLRERWEWHSHFYENLLEPSIGQLLPKSALELSASQVEDIIQIYSVCTLVDQSTLVLSAGIKKCTEHNLERYSQATTEEKSMMISPPNESYWITYRIEHLDYIASKLNNDSDWRDKEERLLMTHHIGDRKIFNSRMKTFDSDLNRNVNEIRKEIKQLKISEAYKMEHSLMSKRRPRVKAMSDLVEFDNIEEYKIMKNLIGISGFIFRKKIIEYLKETKLIEGEVGIYDLNDAETLKLLSKLKEYRSEFVKKDVLHYEQTGDTCGACCLMMAEKYFLDTPTLGKQNEDLIHNKSKSQLMEGDVFSLLADEAIKSGLETKLVHSNKEYFSNEQGYIDQSLFERLVEEYLAGIKTGEKKGLISEIGVNINSDLLKKYLDEGCLILLAVMHSNYLHSILLTGHDRNNFMVNNPLKREKTIVDEKTVEKVSKTPVGSWLMAIKNNSNVKKLIDKLPKFRDEGLEHLDSNRLTATGTSGN